MRGFTSEFDTHTLDVVCHYLFWPIWPTLCAHGSTALEFWPVKNHLEWTNTLRIYEYTENHTVQGQLFTEVNILASAMACTKCLRNNVSEIRVSNIRASLGHFQLYTTREVCIIYGEDQIQVIKFNHQQQTCSLQPSSRIITKTHWEKKVPLTFIPHWVKKDSLL